MNFKWQWIASAAGVGLLGASLAPWTFSGAALRLEIARQMRDATGLEARSEGRAVFALMPRPRVKIANFQILGRDGHLLIDAETLRGELRWLPLFAGRMELESVTLVTPKLLIDLDAVPFDGGGLVVEAPVAGPAGEPPAASRPGALALINGSAIFKSKARSVSIALDNINLTADWRDWQAPAGLKGSFQHNGGTAEIAGWLATPAQLLAGKSSDLSLRLASAALNLTLNGSLSWDAGPQYQGSLSASAPAARVLASGFERGLPLPGPLENVSIVSSARVSPKSIALSDLRLLADGNLYEGALIFEAERPRPMLSGTLASEFVDLGAFFADMPEIPDARRLSSAAPWPAAQTGPVDIDLRVSARRARFGRTQWRDAGFSILIDKDRAEYTLAEAKAFNGLVKGRIALRPLDHGAGFQGSLTLSRIDAGALAADIFSSQRLSGEANAEITLSGAGTSPDSLLRSLRGEARFDIKSGDFSGLDLEQALRRLEKRPLAIASEVRSGRTGFTSGSADLKIENGVAIIRDARVAGPGAGFEVSGSAGLADRALDLTLLAHQSGGMAPAPGAGPFLSIGISGPWDAPRLTLDGHSLIGRAQEAAPLPHGAEPAPAAAK